MTIDRDAVNKLQNLDEKQFKEAVEKISKQLNIDSRTVDMITKNSENIKRKLSKLSDRDLNKLVNKVGDVNYNAIIDELKNR